MAAVAGVRRQRARTVEAAPRLAISVFSSLAESPKAVKTTLFVSRTLRMVSPRIGKWACGKSPAG
ncbi:MAG: hypothetical protein A2W68_15150 [Betaproteobacteria bacterium RIFCSPLOWO2_02_64_14]|nr:MAG: hypothetical protein A2W68_15150 [Betaproteobacteria bacterium RIFCSPLOWO2_02_64_14]